MTFSATLLPTTNGTLGYLQSIGISSYLSEFQHQDIGIRGCAYNTGLCFYSSLLMNGTSLVGHPPRFSHLAPANLASQTNEVSLNQTTIPSNTTLHIRATPLTYHLGYSLSREPTMWLASVSSSWLAFAPTNFFVFEGASFALFASGNGNPWPADAPNVGFEQVNEVYFEEDIPDYDIWT
jgi:hypothetical protein